MSTADLARVRALVELRKYDEALATLGSVALAPDESGDAHCLRAQALLGMGRPREAGAAARQACALLPHDEWPHRLLAISEQDRGRHRPALRAAQEAARLAPLSVHAQHVLALCQLNAGDSAGAELTAARCTQLAPTMALAHQTVAQVAMLTGKLPVAEAAARRTLELRPQDDGAQALLATILERAGRAAEARDLRVSAVRTNPHSRIHRRNLARRAAVPVIAVGWLGKFVVLRAVLGIGQVAAPGDARSGDGSGLAHPVVLAILHAAYLGIWAIWAWRRRRAGADLPAGFYDGLRPERRMSDTSWLLVAGGLMAIWTTAALLGWGSGTVRGQVVIADAAVAVAEIAGALLWRRRLTQRYDVRARRWRLPDSVGLLAARLTGGRRLATRGRSRLDALSAAGEPRVSDRLAIAIVVLLVIAVPGVVAVAAPWWGLAFVALAAVGLELHLSRRPARLGGGGYRVVLSAGGTVPASRWQLVARGLLRVVLLPLLVLETVAFARRPHRFLHDRLSGTTVTRFRTALDMSG